MPTCQKCGKQFAQTVLIEGKLRNLQHRSKCLSCSPFGSPYVRRKTAGPYKRCALCKGLLNSTRRRFCGSCNTKIRRYRAKKAAIAYMGGKCIKCGWSGHQSGFSFHHLDASKKELSFGRVWHKSWSVLRRELSKCVLLCLVCHAIEHSTREDAELIRVAEGYKGQNLVW